MGRVRPPLAVLWIAGFLLPFAGLAHAKGDKPDPLREAQKLVEAQKPVDAVRLYGAELALAQKKDDLLRQQRVVRAIIENVKPYMMKERPVRTLLLRTLLRELNPKKAYAFITPMGLAGSLLTEMTAGNDRTGLPEVMTVCVLQAKRKQAGPYEAAMLSYAKGLAAIDAGTVPEALTELNRAFEIARKAGWADCAVHVGTELAAQLLGKGDAKRCALALQRIAQVVAPRADVAITADWVELVKTRLAGASEEALKPYNQFMESEPLKATDKTGTREAVKSPGTSKLGENWKKVGKSKPLVTVTRKGDEYEIFLAFNKDRTPKDRVQPGVTRLHEGGLTLSFWDHAVRLEVADVDGWRAIPAPTQRPHPLMTYTPLAPGTVWGVNRKGHLVVKHPKSK